jgi:Tfp pilus assembly PilM family ATPase
MFSRLNHVGFNITRTKLQLVEVVRESSKFCLENVDEHIFEEELNFNQDESKIISILQTALNSLTSRAPLKSKNISISIPLNEFKIFEIPFETSLSQTALDEHIKWEFSILFPMIKSNDYIIRTLPLANRENHKRILVVGLAKKTVKAIYNFSIQNNLVLKTIDNSHFAFNSTINFSESQNILSIYLCSISCSVNSYLGKDLQTVQQFEIYDNTSLIDSVGRFIDNQNIAYDKIYLASSLEVDDLKIALEEKLNNSIEVANPFESLITSESFIQNAHFMNKPNSFSAAAGICYRKF